MTPDDAHRNPADQASPHLITPAATQRLANNAGEAIRALNHATLPADAFPGLQYPSDAYYLLGALQQLAFRLPQLLMQISAFLQRELQYDAIVIDDGPFLGDPFGAVGTATHALEDIAVRAARTLATAVNAAHEAIAFAAPRNPDDQR